MPVRKIGLNSRSMTGRHGFYGQQYESALERDFLDLMAFDLNVERLETQPVRIVYVSEDGKEHTYTPDALVWYRRDVLPARDIPHLLVEVKFREEYRNHFNEFKERFRAARRYARERDWRFRVVTDREIRTPYLKNALFLRPYRDTPVTPSQVEEILREIERAGRTTPARLLDVLATEGALRAQYLAQLWRLIARLEIATDLMQPLTMRGHIWLPCG